MGKQSTELLLSQEILRYEVESALRVLSNKSQLFNLLMYEKESINKSLKQTIEWAIEILSVFVDRYYLGFYDMPKFVEMNIENFEYSVRSNENSLISAQKLIRFLNV